MRGPPSAPASWSNHHRLKVVSSSPLPGMPGESTWSNALTRSLATTSIRLGGRLVPVEGSAGVYRSRTLPE